MPGGRYDAEAFAPLPGPCFLMISRRGEAGPIHSPEPVAWRNCPDRLVLQLFAKPSQPDGDLQH